MKKLRPSGGYRLLASFQTTTIIYDATVWFCVRFLDARSRTVDQMIQTARSGVSNRISSNTVATGNNSTQRDWSIGLSKRVMTLQDAPPAAD